MQNFKSREIWLLIQALGVKNCCIIARSAGLILCGRPTTSLGQTQRVASLAALVLPVCGMTCLPMREDHASRKIIIGVGFGSGMWMWERTTIVRQGEIAQRVQVSSIMPRHTLNDCNSQQPLGEGHCHRKHSSPSLNGLIHERHAGRSFHTLIWPAKCYSLTCYFLKNMQIIFSNKIIETGNENWFSCNFL